MNDYSSSDHKKKERAKARAEENIARMQGSMRRIHGTLHPLTNDGMPATDLAPVPFRLMLMDLTLEGLSLFSGTALGQGQRVEIKADLPEWYMLQATVLWCNRANVTAGLVKLGGYSYRMGIQWTFGSESEQDQLKRVFASLKQE